MAANRIIDLRKKEYADGRLVSLDVGDLGSQDGGIRIDFRNVWFRYPTRDVPILNGLNLTVGCLPKDLVTTALTRLAGRQGAVRGRRRPFR